MKNIILIFIGFWLLTSCSVDPVTGKRTFNLIPEEQEMAMGREYDPQISAMYGIYEDKALREYVAGIVERLGKVSHRSGIPYKARVMDSPVVNAFAIPGGYVYVTRGLLAYLEDEAALAGVMGHEIGHVAARHSVEQMSQAQLLQIGLGLGAALSETFARYAGIAQQGLGLLFLKFGRDDEREADRLGVEYATKIGYDTHSMAAFFTVLDRMSSANGPGLPDFLSTHPNPRERVAKVGRLTEEWEKKVNKPSYVKNREAYLNHIDGLVFGNDPRQGFVENNVFYHPGLKFQFPTPAGWKVNNLPTQVQMVAEKQAAAIIFKLDEAKTAATAADVFVQNNKLRVESRKSLKVHGAPAVELTGIVAGARDTVKVMSYFIRHKQAVYSFVGYSSPAGFHAYAPLFRKTMGGLRGLTDRDKLNRQPLRVHIRALPRAMTLTQALKYFKVPGDKMEEHFLLNASLKPGQKLKKGFRIKVVS